VIGLAISLMVQLTMLAIRLTIIAVQLTITATILLVSWMGRTLESKR
jgi:hypothetical protein